MRPADKLLAAYLGFMTVVVVVRVGVTNSTTWWLLLAHALVAVLIVLCTRLDERHRTGQVLYVLYPLLLTPILYSELGVLSLQTDISHTFARDALVQQWEQALFGQQISYDWIREAPSVFWSGVFHLAYFSYYAIVILGPVLLLARGRPARAERVVFATILAFMTCYVVFALFPVAGPNYAFDHPTGPVRDVWSARLVYWVLDGGSAFGTAFPSSHVAATVAAIWALWREWRPLAVLFVVPAVLLVIGTVYCQMHYGVDALSGIAIGAMAGWVGGKGLGARG